MSNVKRTNTTHKTESDQMLLGSTAARAVIPVPEEILWKGGTRWRRGVTTFMKEGAAAAVIIDRDSGAQSIDYDYRCSGGSHTGI
jgi:hypothetical protein